MKKGFEFIHRLARLRWITKF